MSQSAVLSQRVEIERGTQAKPNPREIPPHNPPSPVSGLRQIERGVSKRDAALVFARIARQARRPAGKLRSEIIPESSWKRSGDRLRPTASQTVARLQRVLATAENVFESDENAVKWLTGAHRMLGGATPYSLLRTEAGGRAVEDILAALDYGFGA